MKNKTKNLFLLPSTLATFLLILPVAKDYVLKVIDEGKLNTKETANIVFVVAGILVQQTLRYQEQEDLHTPGGVPGKDKETETPDHWIK